MPASKLMEIVTGSLMTLGIVVFAADAAPPRQDAPAAKASPGAVDPNLKHTPMKGPENNAVVTPTEPAITSGLRDTLKTNVRVVDPNATGTDETAVEPDSPEERRRVEVLKSNKAGDPYKR